MTTEAFGCMKVRWTAQGVIGVLLLMFLVTVPACTEGNSTKPRKNEIETVEDRASGTVRVGDLQLRRTSDKISEQCKKAARKIKIRLYCTRYLPVGFEQVSKCSPCDGMYVLSGYFVNDGFSSESGRGVGHINIWASPPHGIEELFVGCRDGDDLGEETVRGNDGRWITCPTGSAIDSGHLLFEFSEDEITYAASLRGGNTELNRAVLRFLVEKMSPTP